jgi:hypothetical protein
MGKEWTKSKGVRRPRLSNPLISLVELNGIELGTSRWGTTKSFPTVGLSIRPLSQLGF